MKWVRGKLFTLGEATTRLGIRLWFLHEKFAEWGPALARAGLALQSLAAETSSDVSASKPE